MLCYRNTNSLFDVLIFLFQIVNGGPMKNLSQYIPVDSFDSFGRYVGVYQDLPGVPEETDVVEDHMVSLN